MNDEDTMTSNRQIKISLYAFGCSLFAAALLLSVTASASAGAVAVASAAEPNAEVAKLFKQHCQSCHGVDGRGQTTAGKKVGTKDWTDAATWGDRKPAELAKLVSEGITKDGKEKMKPFAKKLTPEQIDALIAYAQTFKGTTPAEKPAAPDTK